jgi:predicted MFS family arabinose efflux permease
MWWRAAVGLVAIAVGAIWIGQGVGAVHGSFMTGHRQYTAFGVILDLMGLAMLGWAVRVGRSPKRRLDA